jgi:hypothetical protein
MIWVETNCVISVCFFFPGHLMLCVAVSKLLNVLIDNTVIDELPKPNAVLFYYVDPTFFLISVFQCFTHQVDYEWI